MDKLEQPKEIQEDSAHRRFDDHAPPRRVRWLFWVILTAFSVFFAEITIGSMMFPFMDPFGLLVTCPLYGLHILVLATIVLKRGRASFASLYFAGNLFGLYEAYITKALVEPAVGNGDRRTCRRSGRAGDHDPGPVLARNHVLHRSAGGRRTLLDAIHARHRDT